jgi:putative oxidoreductase
MMRASPAVAIVPSAQRQGTGVLEIVSLRDQLEEAAMTQWGNQSWAAVPLRLVVGVILVVAGYIKLTGMDNTVNYFTNQGFPVPFLTAWFIALLEFFGGLALMAGFLVRPLGILYTVQFIIAALWVKFPNQGYTNTRIDLMIIAAAAALYFIGAGPLSIDAVRLKKARPSTVASGVPLEMGRPA